MHSTVSFAERNPSKFDDRTSSHANQNTWLLRFSTQPLRLRMSTPNTDGDDLERAFDEDFAAWDAAEEVGFNFLIMQSFS